MEPLEHCLTRDKRYKRVNYYGTAATPTVTTHRIECH